MQKLFDDVLRVWLKTQKVGKNIDGSKKDSRIYTCHLWIPRDENDAAESTRKEN